MKIKKTISVALSAVFLAAGCACGSGKNPGASAGPDPVGTVTETEEHKITTGLHKIGVEETDKIFIQGSRTDYGVVISSSADERTRKAAALLKNHIFAATGAGLETIEDDGTLTFDAAKKYIVVGDEALFLKAGLAMPTDDIGQTGYYIVSEGESVFIAVKSTFGIINGVLEFLSHTIGYEMYSADTVVYTAGDVVTLPRFDIADRPDFEFFLPSNSIVSDARVGMRFMDTSDIFIPVEGLTWHNSFAYLNPGTYAQAHPEWFSADKTQLCYTAHGDDEAYEEMMQAFMSKMIPVVDASPDVANITITIQDTNTFCNCAACTAEHEKYGTDAAVVIKFCNDVSDRLEAHFEELALRDSAAKRDFNIIFFAYNKTTTPPVKKVNGEFVPCDESVICRDNVGVYIAPITATYDASFYDEVNQTTADAIRGWGALSDKLYMWLYETNYSHYLFPLNSYDTMIETYRFCKENNAVFMFNEGQWNQGNVTCFGKLKEYFNSKALWDVNSDYNKICDDFFANYFREAAEPMRAYFDELQAHLKMLEREYPADINGNIYNNIAQARFWPKRTLDHWMEYIAEAYSAIGKYKAEDGELYTSLERHIRLESIFLRYALISLHGGSYSDATLRELRLAFRDDCAELSVTMLNETSSLASVFSGWGL